MAWGKPCFPNTAHGYNTGRSQSMILWANNDVTGEEEANDLCRFPLNPLLSQRSITQTQDKGLSKLGPFSHMRCFGPCAFCTEFPTSTSVLCESSYSSHKAPLKHHLLPAVRTSRDNSKSYSTKPWTAKDQLQRSWAYLTPEEVGVLTAKKKMGKGIK